MPLQIPEPLQQQILHHAQAAYPQECCGILGGRIAGPYKEAHTVLPAENTRADLPETRYRIEPCDVKQADDQLRAKGQDIIGFYHSHPDGTASPSAYDREQACPGYSYLIVSVVQGRAGLIQSWVQSSERGPFTLEAIKTAETAWKEHKP